MRQVRVPKNWSGHDALITVAFLENVIAAIWRQHGYEMAECLATSDTYRKARRPPRPRTVQPSLPLADPHF